MRRPDVTLGPDKSRLPFIVTPHDPSGELPPFAPFAPDSDWTPAHVRAVAATHAVNEGKSSGLSERRVSGAAERALYLALPDTVKRCETSV